MLSKIEKVLVYQKKKGAAGVARAVASRLAANRLMLSNPYDFVQVDAVHNLERYIQVNKSEVGQIIIVGAHMAHEVGSLSSRFPNCRFTLFEASPRYIEKLRERFNGNPRVDVVEAAVSDQNGSIEFFETSLEGSGSTQKLGELAEQSYDVQAQETYEVKALRLDDYLSETGNDSPIDCLWIDVQGAEERVLAGASTVLSRVRSVFVEISIHGPLYEDGSTFEGIRKQLAAYDLIPASLGTDYLNGTGNALFIRQRKAGAVVQAGSA